jgi:hypothetical protein
MGMAGELVPFVMIPRFTSYFGANEFSTVALDVSAFAGGTLSLWRGKLMGTSPTFKLYTENSHDGYTWFPYPVIAGVPQPWDPGADTAIDLGLDLSRRYFRVRIVLTGTDVGVTCWCTGLLEYRLDS